MSALVKQLRLLQAWYLPAGPEPEEAMPSKYRVFKEAADRIVELERDLAAANAKLAAKPDVAGLVEALKETQFQIDEDGTNIGVSRQAVEEARAALLSLSAQNEELKSALYLATADVDAVDRLTAQLQEKEAECEVLQENLTAIQDALDYLHGLTTGQVVGLRQDAERYRWLRDIEGNDPGCDRYMEIVWFTSSRDWDTAIDAQIAARKP